MLCVGDLGTGPLEVTTLLGISELGESSATSARGCMAPSELWPPRSWRLFAADRPEPTIAMTRNNASAMKCTRSLFMVPAMYGQLPASRDHLPSHLRQGVTIEVPRIGSDKPVRFIVQFSRSSCC